MDKESVNDKSVNDESVNDEAVNDKSMDEKSVADNSVKEIKESSTEKKVVRIKGDAVKSEDKTADKTEDKMSKKTEDIMYDKKEEKVVNKTIVESEDQTDMELNIATTEGDKKINVLKKIKASFQSKKFKGGAYATTISAIVIALIVIINLFVTELDIKVDMTSDGKYSLTDETINMIKNIDDKITIYFLAETGSENETFKKIVENYAKVSDNISLVYKDPVKYPKFAAQYVEDTIQNQSFIVVNETNNRAKYVDYNDMLVTEMDYQTYQSSVTGVDVEGRVDAAIQYVTNEDLPKIYEVEGHSEIALTSSVKDILSKANINSEKINTLSGDSIPEDCDVLYINHPQSDFSKEELDFIQSYLDNGGDAMINIDYNTSDLSNLKAFIEAYGIDIVPGIVLEGNSGHYLRNSIVDLLPNIISTEFTKDFVNKKFVVTPTSTGMIIRKDKAEDITVNKILTTSDSAYSKTNMNSQTIEKESEDIDGPFVLGLELVKGEEDKKSRIVINASDVFAEDYLKATTFANQDLYINTINSLAEQKNTLNIRTTSIQEETIAVTSEQQNQVGVVTAAIIPLLFIITGAVVTTQRRKR